MLFSAFSITIMIIYYVKPQARKETEKFQDIFLHCRYSIDIFRLGIIIIMLHFFVVQLCGKQSNTIVYF